MNTFSKTSFRQKMFKCAVMIIMLLQAACAAKVTTLGDGSNDWAAPNPSKFTANGSGAALIYSFDMPGEVPAWPEVRPIVQGDAHGGARIVLLLHNQQEIAGRLLAVRDSALVISTNEARDNHFDAQTAGILVVKKQDIQRVIIKGKSRILKGMGRGLLIGARSGFEANNDPSDSGSSGEWTPLGDWTPLGKAVMGGILGGVVGSFVGAVAGAAASKSDKAIDPAMNHDFSALKPLAQFPEKEPPYLSAAK